ATMKRKRTCLTAPATTQTKSRISGSPTSWIHRGMRIFPPEGGGGMSAHRTEGVGRTRITLRLKRAERLRYGGRDGLLPRQQAYCSRAEAEETRFRAQRATGRAAARRPRDLHRPNRRGLQLVRAAVPGVAAEGEHRQPERPAARADRRDAGSA